MLVLTILWNQKSLEVWQSSTCLSTDVWIIADILWSTQLPWQSFFLFQAIMSFWFVYLFISIPLTYYWIKKSYHEHNLHIVVTYYVSIIKYGTKVFVFMTYLLQLVSLQCFWIISLLFKLFNSSIYSSQVCIAYIESCFWHCFVLMKWAIL